MVDVCLKTLKSLDPHNATTSNWLYKMYLEAKCTQKIRTFNKVSKNTKLDFMCLQFKAVLKQLI